MIKSPSPSSYRRHVIGVISALLLAIALMMVMWLGDRDDQTSFYIGICVRLGLVLGSIWLAWPQLQKLAGITPRAVLAGIVIILLVGVVFSKRLLPVAILFVVVAIVLQLVMRYISSKTK